MQKHILIYEYLNYFINTNISTSDRLNLEYAKISKKIKESDMEYYNYGVKKAIDSKPGN